MSLSYKQHDHIGSSKTSTMEPSDKTTNKDLNLKATELRLGLPGSQSPERENGYKSLLVSGAKRGFLDTMNVGLGKNGVKESALASAKVVMEKNGQCSGSNGQGVAPAIKAQVVGWPPIRSFRKNTMASSPSKNSNDVEGKMETSCLYVKVSMDGAPYLRKVDLKTCSSYVELSSALEKMFSCFIIGPYGSSGTPSRDCLSESRLMDLLHGSEYVLTYEDKDGDWMLVGDVPWDMFTISCNRMRIMKSSEAVGLAPRAVDKCRFRN